MPLHRRCEMPRVSGDVIEPPKLRFVTAQNNNVFSWFFNTYPIICEATGRVEVEDEQETSPFIYDDFVYFMFERDISLR